MAGPKLDGRSYGLLILAVVVAMAATNLIAQSGVGSQGGEVAAATREVAAATREIAASNLAVAESNAKIADAINKLAEAMAGQTSSSSAVDSGAGSTSTPTDPGEIVPPSNQGIEFSK